jgi:hypothetical protein
MLTYLTSSSPFKHLTHHFNHLLHHPFVEHLQHRSYNPPQFYNLLLHTLSPDFQSQHFESQPLGGSERTRGR